MKLASLFISILGVTIAIGSAAAQVDGTAAYAAFLQWKASSENAKLAWEPAIQKYETKLKADGLQPEIASKTIRIIEARDEASLYDPVFANAPKFDATPNRLLMEAIKTRKPGAALDVGMGQGRNALYLAKQGWQVTGFDVSKVGLEQAKASARSAGLKINAVLAADEEFDIGISQWDLIAILYPIEKRSVFRVKEALKPGGLIVIECAHKESGKAPFEYESSELLKIFDGFRILKYEEPIAMHDWARKEMRLVRLIAQKPQ